MRPPRPRRADALARIGQCEAGEKTNTVQLKVDDGARVVLDVVRALDAAGVEPETLEVREPTLDDVFLTLTGHKAEDEIDEESAPTGRRSRGAA